MLVHYGILGMKWGIRRTQKNKGLNKTSREDKQKSKPNDVKKMSDEELRKIVNRLQHDYSKLERQYSQLSEGNVRKGKEYVQKIIKAGTTVAPVKDFNDYMETWLAVTTTALTLYNNVDKIKAIISKKKR
jgi:hypothetical protein